MRKIWLISILAFVFLSMAVYPAMGAERIHRMRGTVDTYEPGKMLKFQDRLEIASFSDEGEATVMKPANTSEYTFAITPATDVKGTITKGTRVLVRYTEAGGVKTAVSIERIWGK